MPVCLSVCLSDISLLTGLLCGINVYVYVYVCVCVCVDERVIHIGDLCAGSDSET